MRIFLIIAWVLLSGHLWVKANGEVVDASWIERDHSSCCGEDDCDKVEGMIRFTPQGWTVDGLKGYVKTDDILPSQDDKPWVCLTPDNEIRCLFLPGAKN